MARQVVLLTLSLGLVACGGGDDSEAGGSPGADPLTVDASFGEQGQVQRELGPFGGKLSRVLALPDGKLLLLGHRQLESDLDYSGAYPVPRRPRTELFAQRLWADGQPDAAFGEQGTVTWHMAGSDRIDDAQVLSDGSVAVSVLGSRPCVVNVQAQACYSESGFERAYAGVQRLLAGGSIESWNVGVPSLGAGGMRLAESNGQLLVLSTTSYPRGSLFSWMLSRHAFNGELDRSFGQDGVVTSRCNTDGAALSVDGDDSIWVAGDRKTVSYVTPASDLGVCMERLGADGAPHASMPQPLQVPLGLNTRVRDMRVLPDQRVLVAGEGDDDSREVVFAVSFSPDGRLTSDYGQGGVASQVLQRQVVGAGAFSGGAFIDPAGSVLFAGTQSWPVAEAWHQQALSMRFTAPGALDLRWGTDGVLVAPQLASGAAAQLVQRDASRRWLVVSGDGAASNQPTVVTLTRLQGESR